MSTKVEHRLSFWTLVIDLPTAQWKDRSLRSVLGSVMRSTLMETADKLWSWGGHIAVVRGPSLKGCKPVILKSEPAMWSSRIRQAMFVGFPAFHYALRHFFPHYVQRWVQRWSVSSSLWIGTVLPLALLIAKVWHRYSSTYYVYKKTGDNDRIGPLMKMAFDRTLFGEYGKIDTLPVKKMDAKTFGDARTMTDPIEVCLVTDWVQEFAVPALRLKISRRESNGTVYSAIQLRQTQDRDSSWVESSDLFFGGRAFTATNGCLTVEDYPDAFKEISAIAQGGMGKDGNGVQWRLVEMVHLKDGSTLELKK